jgi:LacI family transcriptional regulator
MATIRDVARLAGVSISTVSLALNDTGPVSAETSERIRQAAKTVGYAPNQVAQTLKSGRSKLIGMIVGDISNPFFSRLLREIERRVLDHGHLIIALDSATDPDRERFILDALSAQRVAGVVLASHGNGPDYTAHIRRLKMPIVLIDHKVEGIEADFVGTDNFLTSAMLTEHLIRLGHTRIAHVSGKLGLWTTMQRIQGFRSTMTAAGLPIDESLIVDGDYLHENAYGEVLRLLTRHDRPTAIVAANNVMALGALQAINDLGFKCPSEVSLAGIDDVPWSAVIQPRLTTALQPVESLAGTAIEWLIERIYARGTHIIAPRERIWLPSLFVGSSTAAPPAG